MFSSSVPHICSLFSGLLHPVHPALSQRRVKNAAGFAAYGGVLFFKVPLPITEGLVDCLPHLHMSRNPRRGKTIKPGPYRKPWL